MSRDVDVHRCATVVGDEEGEELAATCDGPTSFLLVVTSTQEESPFFSIRATSLDELDCETPKPSATPTLEVRVDACVLGTWAIDMAAFRRSLEQQVVGEVHFVSVSGDILVTFLDDGQIESEIADLEFVYRAPFEGTADRIQVTMVWDGTGGGRWSADGDEIMIATDSFDMNSSQQIRVDGGPPVGGSNPPADDLFGSTIAASGNGYRCTDATLEIEGVSIGREQAVWQRR